VCPCRFPLAGGAGAAGPVDLGAYSALGSIAPYPAAITAAATVKSVHAGGSGLSASALVLALLALAALAVAGTAMLRRRQLASRPGHGSA
jgi:hypothetical protein